MSNTIEIILKAIDNATKDINNVSNAVKGIGSSAGTASPKYAALTDQFSRIIAPAALATSAIYGIRQSLEETTNYAKQVEDLSTLIGATPEDASRLIQVADDVRVSYQTLSGAMEAAIRKGYDPSIEGMGRLAEKYQSIQDPIARSAFLMDTFGKSGADMAKLMQLPIDKLHDLAKESDQLGLTLSGKNLEDTKAYYAAMDTLGDRVFAVKVKVGLGLIPPLISFIENGVAVEETANQIGLAWMDWIPVLGAVRDSILWIIQYGSTIFGGKSQANLSVTSNSNTGYGHAAGADFIVPPGFNNDNFPLGTAQSGERVTITPAGKTGGAGGGGNFVFNYAPMFSLGNREEVESTIRPMVLNILRSA